MSKFYEIFFASATFYIFDIFTNYYPNCQCNMSTECLKQTWYPCLIAVMVCSLLGSLRNSIWIWEYPLCWDPNNSSPRSTRMHCIYQNLDLFQSAWKSDRSWLLSSDLHVAYNSCLLQKHKG